MTSPPVRLHHPFGFISSDNSQPIRLHHPYDFTTRSASSQVGIHNPYDFTLEFDFIPHLKSRQRSTSLLHITSQQAQAVQNEALQRTAFTFPSPSPLASSHINTTSLPAPPSSLQLPNSSFDSTNRASTSRSTSKFAPPPSAFSTTRS